MIKSLKKIGSTHNRYGSPDVPKVETQKQEVVVIPTEFKPNSIPVQSLGCAPEDLFDQAELDLYEERAAIIEHDARLSLVVAEASAAVEVLSARARGPAEILLYEFDAIEIKGALYDLLPKFKDMDENGITRLPNRARQESIRETIAPWNRVPSAGNAGW